MMLAEDVIPCAYAALMEHIAEQSAPQPLLDFHPSRSSDIEESLHALYPQAASKDNLSAAIARGFWREAYDLPLVAATAGMQPWFVAKYALFNDEQQLFVREQLCQQARQSAQLVPPDDNRNDANPASLSFETQAANTNLQMEQDAVEMARSTWDCGATPSYSAPSVSLAPMWCAPQDAYFLSVAAEDATDDAVVLCNALGRCGLPIVPVVAGSALQGCVQTLLAAPDLHATEVTPKLVREHLATAPAMVLSAALDGRPRDAAMVLAYASADGTCAPRELLGVPVPLGSGAVARFQRCSVSANRVVYMCPLASFHDVFEHNCAHRVIHRCCHRHQRLSTLLRSPSLASVLNVKLLRLFDARHVFLPRCLPLKWLRATNIASVRVDSTELLLPPPVVVTREITGCVT